MIANEKQYKISRSRLQRLQKAFNEFDLTRDAVSAHRGRGGEGKRREGRKEPSGYAEDHEPFPQESPRIGHPDPLL